MRAAIIGLSLAIFHVEVAPRLPATCVDTCNSSGSWRQQPSTRWRSSEITWQSCDFRGWRQNFTENFWSPIQDPLFTTCSMCWPPPLLFLFLTRWEARFHQNYQHSPPNWQLSLYYLTGQGSGGWPTVEAQDVWCCGGQAVTCTRWRQLEVDCLVYQHSERGFHKAGVSNTLGGSFYP